MTEIQQMMVDLHRKIQINDYYAELYIDALVKNRMGTLKMIQGVYPDTKIIDMCNDFWESLPDSMEIHREPFQLLCDICASDYNED